MKNLLIIVLFFSLISAVLVQTNGRIVETNGHSSVPKRPEIKIIDYQGLKPLLEKKNDTTYIINFWATWCIPCVKELPEFIKLNSEMKSGKFKMILVSLDFKSQIDKVLIPYIEKNNIDAEVIVLSDPDANTWINKVNKDWSGSLPATIIYNYEKKKYYFREGSFTYEELKSYL